MARARCLGRFLTRRARQEPGEGFSGDYPSPSKAECSRNLASSGLPVGMLIRYPESPSDLDDRHCWALRNVAVAIRSTAWLIRFRADPFLEPSSSFVAGVGWRRPRGTRGCETSSWRGHLSSRVKARRVPLGSRWGGGSDVDHLRGAGRDERENPRSGRSHHREDRDTVRTRGQRWRTRSRSVVSCVADTGIVGLLARAFELSPPQWCTSG